MVNIKYNKRIIILFLSVVLITNVCFRPKEVNAEVLVGSGLALLYFASTAVAAGVIYYNADDITLAFQDFQSTLTPPELTSYIATSYAFCKTMIEGNKVVSNDNGLLSWLKNKYSAGNPHMVGGANVGVLELTPDLEIGESFRFSNKKSKSRKSMYVAGQLLTIDYGITSYNGVQLYVNNELIIDNIGNFGFRVIQYEDYTRIYGEYVNQNRLWSMDVGLDDTPFPLEGKEVPYGVSSPSYVNGGTGVGSVALDRLPYVPGVTTLDEELGGVVFPGSIEDVLARLNEDTGLLSSVLDRLIGMDNAGANALAPSVPVALEDGSTLFPGLPVATDIPGVPDVVFPDVPDIPGVPDVVFPDAPVVTAPGLWGWLAELLMSLYNLIRSLPGAILKGLLDLLKSLFIPKENILLSQLAVLENIINEKIGVNKFDYIFDTIKGLNGKPLPDLYLYNAKVFNASYVNSLATKIKEWQRWFYYLLIVLYQMNNVYKLIRSGDVVSKADLKK